MLIASCVQFAMSVLVLQALQAGADFLSDDWLECVSLWCHSSSKRVWRQDRTFWSPHFRSNSSSVIPPAFSPSHSSASLSAPKRPTESSRFRSCR